MDAGGEIGEVNGGEVPVGEEAGLGNGDLFGYVDGGHSVIESEYAGTGEDLCGTTFDKGTKPGVEFPEDIGGGDVELSRIPYRRVSDIADHQGVAARIDYLFAKEVAGAGLVEFPLYAEFIQCGGGQFQDHGLDNDLPGGYIDLLFDDSGNLAVLLRLVTVVENDDFIERVGFRLWEIAVLFENRIVKLGPWKGVNHREFFDIQGFAHRSHIEAVDFEDVHAAIRCDVAESQTFGGHVLRDLSREAMDHGEQAQDRD